MDRKTEGIHATSADFVRYDQVDKKQRYHLAESADEAFDDEYQIRTCDLGRWLKGNPSDRQAFARELGEALEGIGFAILEGHGLPVSLWDEATQTLVPGAWHCFPEWIREVRFRPGEGIAGTVAQRREGMIVDDYRTSPYAHPLLVERTGATAVLAEPLLYRGRLVGVITLNTPGVSRSFTPQDRDLLTPFAAQAATAIENARLYEALEARLSRLQTLTHLNQVVSSSLDMNEVLSEIARAAAQLIEVPFVAFWIADENTQTLELRAVSDECLGADFSIRQIPFGQGGVGWVATHHHSLHIPNIFDEARITAQLQHPGIPPVHEVGELPDGRPFLAMKLI